MTGHKRSYDVIAHREEYPEGAWWVFEIPALGAAGQTSRLSAVGEAARGIIAAWDEDGPSEDEITVTVRLDGEAEARRVWEEAEAAERAARAALSQAAERRREAVAILRQQRHYSVADTARVLGVTRQRIYQLSK